MKHIGLKESCTEWLNEKLCNSSHEVESKSIKLKVTLSNLLTYNKWVQKKINNFDWIKFFSTNEYNLN